MASGLFLSYFADANHEASHRNTMDSHSIMEAENELENDFDDLGEGLLNADQDDGADAALADAEPALDGGAHVGTGTTRIVNSFFAVIRVVIYVVVQAPT
jgi:hypothetical protein